MTVTPALAARPRTEDVPAPARGQAGPTHGSRRRAGGGLRAMLPWARLLIVLLAAVLSQVIYVFIWPLSYFMTQAPDYTYEYLIQYPEAWERLSVMLVRFEQFWPGASGSLEFLVDALMQAFIGAFILYLIVGLMARWGLPPVLGTVAIVAPPLAFHATLFAMPGLYTTDLFSYVMYSHIAGVLQVNPYTSAPAWFPEVRILQWIHPLWHNAPSIYGPAWIDLTLQLARSVATASDVDKVLAYKGLINLWHLFGIACLAYIVHRVRPGHVLEAVALYAWNPLIVFEFGGNGHNDAVMVSAMLLGLALYVTSTRWLGFVTVTVSMLLKMTSLFLMPFYAMAWARDQRTWLRFFGVGLLAAVSAPIVIVAFYWPWWNGIETIGPIINWTQGPMFNNYTPDILAYYLAGRDLMAGIGVLDPQSVLAGWRDTIKTVARVIFVVWCAVEMWRVRGPLGIAGAGARVMLLFLLVVNTWVLPWYFSWPLALAIVVGWESTTAKVLLGFSLSAPTVMYYHHFWHPYMADTTYLLYLAPLLIAPVAWMSSLTMHRWRAWRRPAGSRNSDARGGLAVVDVRT
jgi:hypothetical protein